MYLSRFTSLQPTYFVEQTEGLNWLSEAHARHSSDTTTERFAKLIRRYGCGPEKISQRGTYLRDFTHLNWPEMQIFANTGGEPASVEARMAFFNEVLMAPLERLYPEGAPDFSHLIHVTCTGYVSPSLVQTLVSHRGWGDKVECLHAYHMGCYASLPALRMARGNLPCEILHTELCTLHLNPANHDPEQMVIQSLFADGVIRYRVSAEPPTRGYEILALREILAPASLGQMTWDVSANGFKMTLGREVPKLVAASVRDLVKAWGLPGSVFAIHPGGPRIIDAVKEALELSEEQVFFSREVLRRHGNMSSATLPHVWERMLGDLPTGTPVVSMAFGPGLTLAASLMRSVS